MASPDETFMEGQQVEATVEYRVPDDDGVLTANTGVTVAVIREDGTEVTPAPTVGSSSTGIYTAQWVWPSPGLWWVVFSPGSLKAPVQDSFVVQAARA